MGSVVQVADYPGQSGQPGSEIPHLATGARRRGTLERCLLGVWPATSTLSDAKSSVPAQRKRSAYGLAEASARLHFLGAKRPQACLPGSPAV